MEDRHKRAIQGNFSSLVETTDLDSMVTALYERGVFSEAMIEPYRDSSNTQRDRKRKLYRDITRRGPQAFGQLLEVLKELGYWDLVRELDPNSPLHPRPHRTNNNPTAHSRSVPHTSSVNNFISIGEERHKTKSECEPPTNTQIIVNSNATNSNEDNSFPFKVIKSTKFIEDSENGIKPYSTRGKKRGIALLLTFMNFEGAIEDQRPGVEVDIKNLKYLFDELGFTVLSYVDLSLKETEKTLSSLSGVVAGFESVFVVVSSHGYDTGRAGDNDLRCSDGGLLSLRAVLAYFSNSTMPRLAPVPKVFIFQNCRGPGTDYVWSEARPAHLPMPETAEGASPDGTEARAPSADGRPRFAPPAAPVRQSLYSNILIAQSTLPGQVSFRDPKLGSWYIQVVCAVFAAHAHDTHVDELFTLVDKEMARLFHVQTSSVDRWGFNQRLYLHPGLAEPSAGA